MYYDICIYIYIHIHKTNIYSCMYIYNCIICLHLCGYTMIPPLLECCSKIIKNHKTNQHTSKVEHMKGPRSSPSPEGKVG